MRYPKNTQEPADRGGRDDDSRDHRGHRGGGRPHGRRLGSRPDRHGFGHGHGHDSHHRCEHHRDRSHEQSTERGQGRRHGVGERHSTHEQPNEHARGGTHHRPTLERSIVKSARRIRRSGLSSAALQHRIAATVSHADYVTTMRTLRRIGAELRDQR